MPRRELASWDCDYQGCSVQTMSDRYETPEGWRVLEVYAQDHSEIATLCPTHAENLLDKSPIKFKPSEF